MRRTFATLAVAAVTMAACGGGGTPPAEYAQGVCQATTDWLTAITAGGQELGGLDEGASAEEGKATLVAYLEDVVDETDAIIGELNDLGEPDAENGAKVHEALLSTFEQSKTIYEDALASAEQLPTDSPEAFNEAASQINDEMNTAFEDINSDFEGIENDVPQDLKDAFDEAEACQDSGLFG